MSTMFSECLQNILITLLVFSLFRFHLYIIKWDTYIGCSTEMPALYNLFGGSFYRTPHVNDCQRIHVCAPWKNERIIKFVLLQSVNIRHYWNRKGSVAQTDHFGWILWEVVFTLIDYYTSVEFNHNFSNEVGILATWLTDFPCQTYIDQWPKQH